MIGGGDPFYLKFWVKLTVLERNRRFSLIEIAYGRSIGIDVIIIINLLNKKTNRPLTLICMNKHFKIRMHIKYTTHITK